MEHSLSLASYISEWMDTYKRTSVKQSTFDRLETSIKALEGHSIALMPIDEITSIDIQKYVNGLVRRGYALSAIKKQTRITTVPLKQAAALHLPGHADVNITYSIYVHLYGDGFEELCAALAR